MDESRNNNLRNGTKMLGGVVGGGATIVALITGIHTIVGEMQYPLLMQIEKLEAKVAHFEDRVPQGAADLARLSGRFDEVEEQFRSTRERHEIEFSGHQRRITNVEELVSEHLIDSAKEHTRMAEQISVLMRKEGVP
jgi:hypothetical protein